jgi:hypothetical protein
MNDPIEAAEGEAVVAKEAYRELYERYEKNVEAYNELSREFNIVEGACEFWHETSLGLGYKE